MQKLSRTREDPWEATPSIHIVENAGEQIAASVTKKKRKRIWKSLGHWAKEWSRNAKNAEATQPNEKRWHQYSESLVLASWSFPGISEKGLGWDRGCFMSSNFSDWVITLGALCVLSVSWKLKKWCRKQYGPGSVWIRMGEEPIFYSLASIPCTEFLMDMECEASFTCLLEGLTDLLFKLPYCAWCTIFQKKKWTLSVSRWTCTDYQIIGT